MSLLKSYIETRCIGKRWSRLGGSLHARVSSSQCQSVSVTAVVKRAPVTLPPPLPTTPDTRPLPSSYCRISRRLWRRFEP